MLEVILVVVCVALGSLLLFWNRSHRNIKKQLDEYKTLFELSDREFKLAQNKVQELLEAATYKDVLLERGTNALTSANSGLQDQMNLVQRLAREMDVLQHKIEFQEDQYKKLIHQKKSSEVRTGKITEQIAPFLEDYPLDPHTARFLGDPIDLVHFDEKKITFVEVKSGKSQLSKKQRQIRDLVKAGKVEFIIYRVEGNK